MASGLFHPWVLFGSRHSSRFSPGYSGYPPSQKATSLNNLLLNSIETVGDFVKTSVIISLAKKHTSEFYKLGSKPIDPEQVWKFCCYQFIWFENVAARNQYIYSSQNGTENFISGVSIMSKNWLNFTHIIVHAGCGTSDAEPTAFVPSGNHYERPWVFLLNCTWLADKARGSHDSDWCLNGISGSYSSRQEKDSKIETKIIPGNC